MGITFRSATASELRGGVAVDPSGWARAWRSAASLFGRILDGMVRFSAPYYADAVSTGVLLELVPPARREDVALAWHSRGRRIV